MKSLLSFALCIVVVATTARGAEEPLKGDAAKLQGKWSAKVGPEKNVTITLIFKGNAVTLAVTSPDGQEFESKGEFKLDENAKPYKAVDWIKFAAPNGDPVEDNKGIYELDGDTLKTCSGGPGNERPTEFKAGEGGPPHLITLTREPEKKAAASDDKKDELKGDLAKFQGKWTTMVGPDKDIPAVVTIKDRSASFKITAKNGQEYEFKGEIKIDEKAKPRKTVDWIKFTRPNGEDAPDNLGIYEFEGDSLKICSGGPGNERPTEFKAGESGPPNLHVWTRVKE